MKSLNTKTSQVQDWKVSVEATTKTFDFNSVKDGLFTNFLYILMEKWKKELAVSHISIPLFGGTVTIEKCFDLLHGALKTLYLDLKKVMNLTSIKTC